MSESSGARPSGHPKLLLGVELRDPSWFRQVKLPVAPGARTDRMLTIPQTDAQRLARTVVRRVVDLPVDATPRVVWTNDRSELLVHTSTVALGCTTGLVTVSLRVECDQTGAVPITIPIAVGTKERPAGLIMQAFSHVDGPPIITRPWSEALTAFAWELLVETTRAVAAEVGKDERGRPLIPGAIGAETKVLLVQPMARHQVGKATR
jgi:hypothetical protein